MRRTTSARAPATHVMLNRNEEVKVLLAVVNVIVREGEVAVAAVVATLDHKGEVALLRAAVVATLALLRGAVATNLEVGEVQSLVVDSADAGDGSTGSEALRTVHREATWMQTTTSCGLACGANEVVLARVAVEQEEVEVELCMELEVNA